MTGSLEIIYNNQKLNLITLKTFHRVLNDTGTPLNNSINSFNQSILPVLGKLLERLVALVPLSCAEDEEGGGAGQLRPVRFLDVEGGGVRDGARDLVAEALRQAWILDRVLDAHARQIAENNCNGYRAEKKSSYVVW